MSNIFDDLQRGNAAHEEREARHERDMKEAMRLLMTRREGRVFVQWLVEGQDPRAVMRRVLEYVESTHV